MVAMVRRKQQLGHAAIAALALMLTGCANADEGAPTKTSADPAALIFAFDRELSRYPLAAPRKKLEANDVYHLRRGLQSLVDAWRATGKRAYLQRAHSLVTSAIAAAERNPCTMRRRGKALKTWPCFRQRSLDQKTGGHSQLADFQGATGFLLVALALQEAGDPGWQEIADFVEASIVEKWLNYSFRFPKSRLGSSQERMLPNVLNRNRDNRENAADVFLSLSELGRDARPYRAWGEALVETYLAPRANLSAAPPRTAFARAARPTDWGLVPVKETGGLKWYWNQGGALRVQDTSHANRTVWLATRAYALELVDRELITSLVRTLKAQIWKRGTSRFAFANYVDGSNQDVGSLGPGRAGNLWFGWHRLAAHDDELRRLFIELAEALSYGGGGIPPSQNKAMAEARLCYLAWGARLAAEAGQPRKFP